MTTPETHIKAPTGLLQNLWPAIALTAVITILTGIIYPLIVTGAAQLLFPHQANGSLIDKTGKPTTDVSRAVGSVLIGQWFDQPQYFWPRPSATSVTGSTPSIALPYNAGQSGATNLSPANKDWVTAVTAAAKNLRDADPDNTKPIPIDLVTSSGSGLDPHISIDAARYQVSRIVKARGNVTPEKLAELIKNATDDRSLGTLGEPTVNVLQLNLALDRVAPYTPPAATAPAK